jgi:hypothetical protein
MRQQELRSVRRIVSGVVVAVLAWSVLVGVVWRRITWTSDADALILLGVPLLGCVLLAVVLLILRASRDFSAGIAVGGFGLTCLLASACS